MARENLRFMRELRSSASSAAKTIRMPAFDTLFCSAARRSARNEVS
jgi:hypothetical protein